MSWASATAGKEGCYYFACLFWGLGLFGFFVLFLDFILFHLGWVFFWFVFLSGRGEGVHNQSATDVIF